jgi:hypothetical protein
MIFLSLSIRHIKPVICFSYFLSSTNCHLILRLTSLAFSAKSKHRRRSIELGLEIKHILHYYARLPFILFLGKVTVVFDSRILAVMLEGPGVITYINCFMSLTDLKVVSLCT